MPRGGTPGCVNRRARWKAPSSVHRRLGAVLTAARMGFADIVRFDVYFTDQADVQAFVAIRDRVMGTHKPGATLIVVKGLARPGDRGSGGEGGLTGSGEPWWDRTTDPLIKSQVLFQLS